MLLRDRKTEQLLSLKPRNPADFIINADGKIAFAHYCRHYADSLNAAQVVELCRHQAATPLGLAAHA